MVGQSGTGLEVPIYKEMGWDRVGKGGIDGIDSINNNRSTDAHDQQFEAGHPDSVSLARN